MAALVHSDMPGSRTCESTATMKTAILGFRKAMAAPSAKPVRPDARCCSCCTAGGESAEVHVHRANINRTSAPRTRNTGRACSAASKSAMRLNTATRAYTPKPRPWPKAQATPPRRPPVNVLRSTTARLGPGLMAPRTNTVPAPKSAGKIAPSTCLVERVRLHAVASFGVQTVPCLLSSKHARPIGHRCSHRFGQRGGRSFQEMHQQRRLWVTLRHEQENAVFPLECSSSCIMRASIASNSTQKRILWPLFGE